MHTSAVHIHRPTATKEKQSLVTEVFMDLTPVLQNSFRVFFTQIKIYGI